MTDESQGSGMQIDVDLVRQLALLLDDTHLTEIEVEDGPRRIRVARTAAAPATAYLPAPQAAPAPQAVAPAAPAATPPSVSPAEHPGAVKSPMVGTAYLAAEPGAAPFVSEGKQVSAGDTLLIVEAMKVLNPIAAPKAGKIVRILVDNGQPVEFDQPLVVIE